MENLDKRYAPSEVEDKIYKYWVEQGCFRAKVYPNKKPYTIVIPPPNVTGQLHMGHALDETMQDILIRFRRMQGYAALWQPGTDHAGIATQIRLEEELRTKEGLTRHDLGREKFLERVWEWKKLYGGIIIDQLKRLGSSCDFDRERFTMDEEYSDAVLEVFVNLYNKGLIYQGSRIINWCPCCTTALSDAEVEHEEKEGNFWHIKYPLAGGGGHLVIATTRPETMLGDTAVAVNPNDERYADLVGKMLVLPLLGREIPIIADEYVDAEFGTGAVKITPAHDPNDFEVGERHGLAQIRVMNDDGSINEHGGSYVGMDRYEARRAIVADLEKQGLLMKTEPHTHNVGQCYRCSTVVEPITSKQWFVKMEPLAGRAIEVVKNGEITFVPARFAKTYLNWMENVHDWCISRQLWWGHRIPAYYCDACSFMAVSKEAVRVCEKCGGAMRQDEDVLDTWFSSALWPFATLGFPKKTADLDYFFPTDTLVTGYDIIFFWVARMIFSSLEHMDKIPFKTVFIHGLVRDAQGRKMSKSLGNGIDPLEIINEYGADALRFTLTTGNAPGNDMRLYVERVEASRNFANKLWNAARFVLMNVSSETLLDDGLNLDGLCLEDMWIISKYNDLVREVTNNLEKFELGIAADKLYEFIWDEFCDWYIELVKPRLLEGDDVSQRVLVYVLGGMLKLLHPFMPFITEEIYSYLPGTDGSIMLAQFPQAQAEHDFPNQVACMEVIKSAIRAVRAKRAELNVPPSKKAQLIIVTDDEKFADSFNEGKAFFVKLAYASEVVVMSEAPKTRENVVAIVTEGAEIFIPQQDLVDIEAERERLVREAAKAQAELERARARLANEGFVAKAPRSVVQEEERKVTMYEDMCEKLRKQMDSIS